MDDPAAKVNLAGLRVLFVNDEETLGYAMQAWSRNQHIEGSFAASTLDALDKVATAKQPYDAIVVDINLQRNSNIKPLDPNDVIKKFQARFGIEIEVDFSKDGFQDSSGAEDGYRLCRLFLSINAANPSNLILMSANTWNDQRPKYGLHRIPQVDSMYHGTELRAQLGMIQALKKHTLEIAPARPTPRHRSTIVHHPRSRKARSQ